MSKEKSVDDELIVAAILQQGTVRAAAESLNITPRTIYDRRRDVNFRTVYNDAISEVYRSAVYSINEKLSEAVNVAAEIMGDQTVNPSVRLQAAGLIINNAAKFSARLNQAEEKSRTMRDPFDILS